MAYLRSEPGAVEGSNAAGLETLPEQLPGACKWQLWHYNPALVPDSTTVDPLSLTLSLQEEADERVQLAFGELRGHFPPSMTAYGAGAI